MKKVYVCLLFITFTCTEQIKKLTSKGYPTFKKKELNIHGTITNLRGNVYPISYALIGSKQRCVRVYKGPCKTESIIPCLRYNPQEYEMHLDLTKVKEISMPYPYATWFYTPRGRHRGKKKYLLLHVAWFDETKAPTPFLVEKKRRISGIIKKESGSSDCTISLSRIKTINFEKIKI